MSGRMISRTPATLIALIGGVLLLVVCASPAHATAKKRVACGSPEIFGTARSHTTQSPQRTTYNRVGSVQFVLCTNFGDTHFDLPDGLVCTVVGDLIGKSFDKTGTFVDGLCAGPSIAAEHDTASRAGQACGLLVDLMNHIGPISKALSKYTLGFGLACDFGQPLGGWIEGWSERRVADALMADDTKCLRFTTHHFPIGDIYDTVRCARSDKGFDALPQGPLHANPSTPAPADPPATDAPATSPPVSVVPAAPTASTPAPIDVPPGSWSETVGGIAHTWTDPGSAGGSEGPSIQAGQTVGIACKVGGFRVTDGNTWWYRIASAPWNDSYYVSADAFYNNGMTSGTLVGTPWVDPAVPDCNPAPAPPASDPTWNETTGGVAHTWTNPANAGGTQGPSIGSNQTVAIACKLGGFRVADGNTWWYRIASAPWNNAYYVSADAFYNNGATSGTLHGTPFVDPAVRDC